MANNNQLSEWFRQGLKKGFSLKDLKKKALEKYPEKQVNEAAGKIKRKPKIFVWIIIVVVLAGLIFAVIVSQTGQIKNAAIKQKCKSMNLTEEYCSALISENLTFLIQMCNLVNQNYTGCNDIAYDELARIKEDKSFCYKINFSRMQEECIVRIK
jgi:hypothetical protein